MLLYLSRTVPRYLLHLDECFSEEKLFTQWKLFCYAWEWIPGCIQWVVLGVSNRTDGGTFTFHRNTKLWICMEFCGGGSLQDIYQGKHTCMHTHTHTHMHALKHVTQKNKCYVCVCFAGGFTPFSVDIFRRGCLHARVKVWGWAVIWS